MNMVSSFRIQVIQLMEKWWSWVKTTTFRIRVLAWAHKLVEFAMWDMMTYLTDIWNLDIIYSAAIINGFNGVEDVMPIAMAYFNVDAFMGEYRMLLLSSLAYSCGVGILAISTVCIGDLQKFLLFMALTLKALGVCGHSVSLSSFLGRQSQNQTPSDELTLKAVGVCGHSVSLSSFLGRQSQNQTPTDEDDDQKRKRPGKFGRILKRCVIVLLVNLATIVLLYIPSLPWIFHFGIPAIGMVVATLLFVSSTSSYKHAVPQVGQKRERPGKFGGILRRCLIVLLATMVLLYMAWSVHFAMAAIWMVVGLVAALLLVSSTSSYKHAAPQVGLLTTVCRVLVSSASKIFCRLPQHSNRVYDNHQPDRHFVPRTDSLRFFDKDVVIVQIQTPDEKAEHIRLKLPKRTELEDAKIFARMIPLWITFIMCGVVSSIGDTYFLEQANKMQEGNVEGFTVPSFMLLIFHGITKFVFGKLFAVVAKKLFEKGYGKSIFPIGVIAAMLFSVVCCVYAAEVETRRLKLAGLLENPEAEIPIMSMFWLLPQYFFLAAIDGISEYLCGDLEEVSGYSIAWFCIAPKYSSSVRSYLRLCTNAAFGLGTIGSTISVYAAGKFSEIRGSSSWFQESLNESHLDYYYLTLAALSSINLALCILVSIWYIYRHLKAMIDEVFKTQMVKKLLGIFFH